MCNGKTFAVPDRLLDISMCRVQNHGGLESTEIQKKMPGFDTHIFQIYVLKIDPNLIEKEAISALVGYLQKFTDKTFQNEGFFSLDSVDVFTHKDLKNQSINLCFTTTFC